MGLLHDLSRILGMYAGVSVEEFVDKGAALFVEFTEKCCATYRLASISLVNGGTAGYIWIFFICWMGFMLVNTSMAEMASM